MNIALITGASGKIGGETVKVFLKNGYFVLGLYNKNERGVKSLKKSLSDLGYADSFFAYKCDLKNDTAIKKTVESIKESFKHIDVFVSVAGAGLYKTFTDTLSGEWDDIFKINVKSAFTLSQFVLESMLPRKSGRIIYVSSIWGKRGAAMETAYSASKAALIGLTKSLAAEVAPSGVTVNCVCPGVIDTAMNSRFNAEEMKNLIERTPVGRLGTAEEVAELIYFLSTEKAAFITGQALTVDGGFTV